jgi:hypothetical protein
MNRKKVSAVLGLGMLVALSFAAVGCGDKTTQVEAQDQAQKGISVTGEGKVTGKPDVAKLSLGVMSESDTVQQARDQAAASMAAIIKSLKTNGVDDKDIQTQQLNIAPQYDYSNGNGIQRLRGFQVTNIVNVTLRDIDKTSQAVDDAVTAGGNDTQIQSLSFTIDDTSGLQQQARAQAVADAKSKAETLAKAAGVNVGEALTISETSFMPPVYYQRAAAGDVAAAPSVSTPVEPGEVDVTVDVSVTWNIN